MFVGLAFLLNGHMSCGVEKDDLMVRVGKENYERCLAKPYARKMDFTGRPMKGLILVNSEGLSEDEDLEY